MFLALLLCALLGYLAIADTQVDIASINPKAFEWKTGSILTRASLMAWGLGYFGQPHILARFFGIKSVEDVPAARRIGMSWMVIALFFSTCIGLIGIGYNEAYGLSSVTGADGNSERIFLALSTALFHPVFSGSVLAAVMAAVMSTADSQLLVLSSAMTEDMPFFNQYSDQQKAWASRISVVVFALLAYLIAVNDNGNILSMVAYAWGGFGAASIVVFKNFVTIEGHYLYELLPSFILSFISIVVVSKFTIRPSDELLNRLKFGGQPCARLK